MRNQLTIVGLAAAIAAGAVGCQGRLAYNLPPSSRLMHPGPGVGGPGPGVIPVSGAMTVPSGGGYAGGPAYGGAGGYCGPVDSSGSGVMQCNYQCDVGCYDGGCSGCDAGCGAGGTSQIAFLGEEGIQVQWDVSGQCMFDSSPLFVPGRQDFSQGAIYRLKVSNLPGRSVVALYPTLEVGPVTPRTDAYLAHAPIPVEFTEEDFDQVLSGNFVTKVIYLPDPEFQELALAGVETLVSTRLDPGVDPIAEADRRGAILAILRMGSKDLAVSQQSGYSDCNVLPAQFDTATEMPGEPLLEPVPGDEYYGDVYEGGSYGEVIGKGSTGGDAYFSPGGDGYVARGAPMGMPTAGFAPPAVPPHQLVTTGPQYGAPITGTPIGLPGPPHIPLGAPAGLQNHVMKNRTRMAIPPPTSKFKVSVKQRPGLNYPPPVRKTMIDETARQPFSLLGLFRP